MIVRKGTLSLQGFLLVLHPLFLLTRPATWFIANLHSSSANQQLQFISQVLFSGLLKLLKGFSVGVGRCLPTLGTLHESVRQSRYLLWDGSCGMKLKVSNKKKIMWVEAFFLFYFTFDWCSCTVQLFEFHHCRDQHWASTRTENQLFTGSSGGGDARPPLWVVSLQPAVGAVSTPCSDPPETLWLQRLPDS